MIDGMRMDLVKDRYETFDELYEYCYRVAGTVGLMTTPIMGIDPAYKVRILGLLLLGKGHRAPLEADALWTAQGGPVYGGTGKDLLWAHVRGRPGLG